MNTPTKVTPSEFAALVDIFLAEKCVVNKPYLGAITCKVCGDHIESVSALMSIHFLQIRTICAGAGETKRVTIPYCAKCEEKPSAHGCIHEEDSLSRGILVEEAPELQDVLA